MGFEPAYAGGGRDGIDHTLEANLGTVCYGIGGAWNLYRRNACQ